MPLNRYFCGDRTVTGSKCPTAGVTETCWLSRMFGAMDRWIKGQEEN